MPIHSICEEDPMINDNQMIDMIMEEFEGFAKCPRPSLHEKQISDHLVKRLTDLGVTHVVQDEANNVIAYIPATEGYENAPLTLLQGHMDMVCVAKPGVPFDLLTSPITLVREGNILHADGTSLGADDGAGLAAILLLLRLGVAHGPLRIIFTTDEETGMTGAQKLDPKYITDLKNIINCDSESLDVICLGSAGSCHLAFTRELHWEAPSEGTALAITASDFKGGHSGETINQGKSNAIQALSDLLLSLEDTVSFRLASFNGGDAANAIPANAAAVIVVKSADEAAVKDAVKARQEVLSRIYKGIEDKATFTVTAAALPKGVFSAEDTEMTINLVSLLHCGTFVMNQEFPLLPELSANIGTIKTTEDKVTFQYFPRAGGDDRLNVLLEKMPVFAKLTGFTLEKGAQEPAWSVNPVSRLAPLYEEAFKKITGRTARMEAIHGGLETGRFYHLNPEADIISVGPDTHHIHSADESVELDSIAAWVRILAETLASMK